MCSYKENEAKQYLDVEGLLTETQLAAILREVDLLLESYFGVKDYDVQVVIRSHKVAIEDAETLEEKYEIAKKLYGEVIAMLMEKTEERNQAQYPECTGVVEYVPEEPIDYDKEELPF